LATANAIHLDRDEARLNLKYGSTGLIASMKAIAATALTAVCAAKCRASLWLPNLVQRRC